MFSIPVIRALSAYNIAYAALPATSSYMSFVPTADTAKQKQWTVHIPVGFITSNNQVLFSAGNGLSNNFVKVQTTATDQLEFTLVVSNIYVGRLTTTRKLRDYGAFTMITCVMDTPNATASDRMRIYIDLDRETDFATATYPALNQATSAFTTYAHYFLKMDYAAYYGDVYLGGNTCLIGQALGPDSFLDLDLVTGNVKAKSLTGLSPEYLFMFENAGAMGTNSGSAGDATVSGTLNQVTSTPTNVYATLDPRRPGTLNLSNGNLTVAPPTDVLVTSTLRCPLGNLIKAQCVIDSVSGTTNAYIGVVRASDCYNAAPWNDSIAVHQGGGWYDGDGGYLTGSPLTFTALDNLDLIWDGSTGTLKIYKNNEVTASFSHTNIAWIGDDVMFCQVNSITTGGCQTSWTFVEVDWTYAAKDSAIALCTDNLPKITDSIDNHFKALTYTGNGVAIASGGNPVSGVGFQPDFVWLKSRSTIDYHAIVDAVRGVTKRLYTNTTVAEVTGTETIGSFDADGFTLGSNTTWNNVATNYVAWCAKLPNIKTSGWLGSPTITPSKEIYNNSAMFKMSIVAYTGNGMGGATIPHSLGVKPGFITVKALGGASSWLTYHSAVGATHYGQLNSTAAFAALSTAWNNTEPTPTLISLGTDTSVNQIGATYVAYIFAPCDGIDIGSYVGNGSADGPMINSGLDMRWMLTKQSGGITSWMIRDNVRSAYNPAPHVLWPDLTSAESTSVAWDFDQLSNGAKLLNIQGENNAAGGVYPYVMIGQPNGPTENTAR